MYDIENRLFAQGMKIVCGVDEAGCGPLAGPVYAAAVVLNQADKIDGLNDSKKLSEKQRNRLFDEIIARAEQYSIAFADSKEIDKINILQARLLAMKKAVESLNARPHYALIDGNYAPALDIHCETVIKGDAKSASIAAASILAKVSRDRYMAEMALKYPQYRFEKHKGYPTALHYELLQEHGPCEIHRISFLKKSASHFAKLAKKPIRNEEETTDSGESRQ